MLALVDVVGLLVFHRRLREGEHRADDVDGLVAVLGREAVEDLGDRLDQRPVAAHDDGHVDARHVARLFVPGYGDGIAINVTVRLSRNSDARRRLGRLIDSRRTVS